jgi:N-acetylglucosamine kinase-like BadF-type ATPase
VLYVLGIDGGGSKTDCLAADETGRLLGYGCGGGVNTYYVPQPMAEAGLRQAIEQALAGAGLEGRQIAAACMSAPMRPSAVDRVMQECGIAHLERAAEGATSRWAARFWVEGHVGVTVDSGTGSLARGWSRDGREVGAGGWGPTLGDEGSGLWISKKAVIAVLQAYDGRLSPTLLTDAIVKHLGLSEPSELATVIGSDIPQYAGSDEGSDVDFLVDSGRVFDEKAAPEGGILFQKVERRHRMRRDEVASLCPVVVAAAQQGDLAAQGILREGGIELARLALAVIHGLEMVDEDIIVVPFGGVFRSGQWVMQPFLEALRAGAPRAKVQQAPFEPVVGAVLLALQGIGVVLHEDVLAAIAESSAAFPPCRAST